MLFRSHRLPLIALLLALPAAAQDMSLNPTARRLSNPLPKPVGWVPGPDRPDVRLEWTRLQHGGDPSPEYLDRVGLLAAREYARWRTLMPSFPLQGERAMVQAAAGLGWRNIGPFGQSTADYPDVDAGRLTAVLVHPTNPKVVYISNGGGLWRCDNADLDSKTPWTWTNLVDSLPSAGGATGGCPVGAFAISPGDPNTLHVALGDKFDATGRGFYKSVDGGLHWTAAALGGLGKAKRGLAMLMPDADTILVGTDDGLKISRDGGLTYGPATGAPATGEIWSLQALGGRILCTVLSGGKGSIHVSDDQGRTWSKASVTPGAGTSLGRTTVAASPASADVAWALYDGGNAFPKGLLKSVDRGQTWSFVPGSGLWVVDGDGGQAWYNHFLTVSPKDPNTLFLGANFALYRSRDGGATWTQMSHWWGGDGHVYLHADQHCAAWSADGATLYQGNDGGLAVVRQPYLDTIPTVPRGQRGYVEGFIDNSHNAGIASHLVGFMSSTTAPVPADAEHRVSIGLQDNGGRVRLDLDGVGLANSGSYDDRVGGDGEGTLFHPCNGDQLIVSCYNNAFARSFDGCATWPDAATDGLVSSGETFPFGSVVTSNGHSLDSNTVYTFSYRDLYRSEDWAGLWKPITTLRGMGFSNDYWHAIRNVAIARSNPQAIAVSSNDGTVVVSYDGGLTWPTKSPKFPDGAVAHALWFDTGDDQVLYAASVNLNAAAHHLWRSVDGGKSWSALDGSEGSGNGLPFGIPIYAIQNDPTDPATLYAATDLGLYRSTSTGANWERYGVGLPMVSCRALYVASDGSYLRVGTYGRGVWELRKPWDLAAVLLNGDGGGAYAHPGQTRTFTASEDVTFQVFPDAKGAQVNGRTLTLTLPVQAPRGDCTYWVVATSKADANRRGRATVTMHSWDLVLDGLVDPLDLLPLGLAWGQDATAPANLKGSGKVDDADVALFIAGL